MLVRNTKYERSFLVFFPPTTPKILVGKQKKISREWGKMGKNEKRILPHSFTKRVLHHYIATLFLKKEGRGER